MLLLPLAVSTSIRPIDDELMARVAKGDNKAFQELYEAARESVYGFALSITRNTHSAEDVLQETFLTVYQKAAGYRPAGKPMAWILTIAKNHAMSRLRAQSKEDFAPEQALEGLSVLDNPEEHLLLEGLLQNLSQTEQQIVMLHAVSGLKHREIAKLLDFSLGSVLSAYHRAIKKLQKIAKEANDYE